MFDLGKPRQQHTNPNNTPTTHHQHAINTQTNTGTKHPHTKTTQNTNPNKPEQTLSDPEQRATYDALAGFDAAAGFDPFSPGGLSAFERDQVFVDEVSCIGCGKCVRACPAAFVIEGSKYGRARVARQPVVSRGRLRGRGAVCLWLETCLGGGRRGTDHCW